MLFRSTRYLNVEGMLPNEIEVVEYVKTTGKSVEYHVEPIYIDDDLVCRGVHIQALSEDGLFKKNVYCFNVQPHIAIDYKTGNSWIDEE